jgi:glucose-1-phosphate cytidylyltransferase
MKVVILCGGFGTRISEESHLKPKPMIEVGEHPILWHIMKIYSRYGFNDFVLCLGYRGYYVKEYFSNYFLHQSDITYDFKHQDQKIIHNHQAEPWTVTLVDTGPETQTGGRVKRIKPYVNNEPFLLTYGDGVANINIRDLVDFHNANGKIATITTVLPLGRWGVLDLDENGMVTGFREKPKEDGSWINAGFFVMQPEIFKYIEGDHMSLEGVPMQRLAQEKQLIAFRHTKFWHPMDTLRDKVNLDNLWKSGNAPWKVW